MQADITERLLLEPPSVELNAAAAAEVIESLRLLRIPAPVAGSRKAEDGVLSADARPSRFSHRK